MTFGKAFRLKYPGPLIADVIAGANIQCLGIRTHHRVSGAKVMALVAVGT